MYVRAHLAGGVVSLPPGEGGVGSTLGAATTRERAGQGRLARRGTEEPQQERWGGDKEQREYNHSMLRCPIKNIVIKNS